MIGSGLVTDVTDVGSGLVADETDLTDVGSGLVTDVTDLTDGGSGLVADVTDVADSGSDDFFELRQRSTNRAKYCQ